MTLAACAALVERGDPDRFRATMAAPPKARARLWPLYAYNLELARAPWVSAEPQIVEMRLHWWAETVTGFGHASPPALHEVAAPLAALVAEMRLPRLLLADMADARHADLDAAPFADAAALWSYLDRSSGNLMWLAAMALGARPETEGILRDFAAGAGLANYLLAVPELIARGRSPLPPGDGAALAREGLARIARARASRRRIPAGITPALLPGWDAVRVLARAAAQPERIAAGQLSGAESGHRLLLILRAVSGRW